MRSLLFINRERLPLFVRVNALATGLLLDDLAAVVRAQPYGIMLPKCASGRDVARVDAYPKLSPRPMGHCAKPLQSWPRSRSSRAREQ